MIISSITLENIRSYKNEKISFNKGVNLLWGDIGSGKSTVLQAIEFAFFGLSKDDGKLLLRKGETLGKVELVLKDENNNKEYIVIRNLKKHSVGIRQDKCFLVVNNEEVEYAPSELDYQLLKILKIPKYKQQKNLAYRYIIYTPQEELKSILEEKPEVRLEIIRKAFNIEKYKLIDQAITTYTKFKRSEKNILLEKIKDFSVNKIDKIDIENKLNETADNLKIVDEKILNLNGKKKTNESNIEIINKSKIKYENDKRNYLLKLNDLKNKLDLKNKYEKDLKNIEDENVILLKNKSVKNLQEEFDSNKKKYDEYNEVQEELKTLELKKKQFEYQKEGIVKRQNGKESRIKDLKNILDKCDEKKLNDAIKIINSKIVDLDKLEEIKNKQLKQIEELKINIGKNKLLFDDKENQQKQLLELKVCSECLQEVNDEHKKKITVNIKIELDKFQKNNDKWSKDIKLLTKDLESTQVKLDDKPELLIDKSNIDRDKKELSNNSQELTFAYRDLEEIKESLDKLNTEFDVDDYNKKIDLQKNFSQFIEKYKNLENVITKIKDNNIKIESVESSIKIVVEFQKDNSHVQEELNKVEIKLKSLLDKEGILNSNKNKLDFALNELFIKQGEYKSDLKNKKEFLVKINENTKILEISEKKIEKINRVENWLVKDVSHLCSRIEKYLFKKFYSEFNDIFEEVFRGLIEDNNIDIRLDDSFTPIIEQNGYDVSINNLSGGEKSSVALAYRFGLSNVLENSLLEKMKLDFIILDEPTDGFSNNQVDRLSHLLNGFNFEQILIVSHDEKLTGISDSILRIEKDNHISKVS